MMWLWPRKSSDHFVQPDDDFVQDQWVSSQLLKSEKEYGEQGWNASFRDACVHLKTLIATPRQVLDYLEKKVNSKKGEVLVSPGLELPKESRVVHWNDNAKHVIPEITKRYRQQNQEQSEQRSSHWFTKIASQLLLYNEIMKNPLEDVETWKEESDDHFSECNIEWLQEVLNIDLAVECCNQLLHYGAGKVMFREGASELCVMGWIRTLPDKELISTLPENQVNLVISSLIDMKLARIVEDLLLIGFPSGIDVDVPIATFRLRAAIDRSEAAVRSWTMQRDVALARAIQYKRQNRNSAALAELRRRNLYDNHLERTHGTLLNLEQASHALETAQSQAQLLQVLEDTAALWKAIGQEGISVRQADDLALDLAEVMEHLDDVNSKVSSVSKPDLHMDELLSELDKLTLSPDTDNEKIDRPQKVEPATPFNHEESSLDNSKSGFDHATAGSGKHELTMKASGEDTVATL